MKKAIKLSLTGLCDFIDAKSDSQRRSILKRYKNNKSGEAKGRSGYYKPAFDAIKRSIKNRTPLEKEIPQLIKDCASPGFSEKNLQTKIDSNLRVLSSFGSVFSNRLFKSAKGKLLYFRFQRLVVSVKPDFFLTEDGNLLLLKIGAKSVAREIGTIEMMLRMMYNSAKSGRLKVFPESMLFLDTATNTHHIPSQKPAVRLRIRSIYPKLSRMWDTVSP